MHTSIYYFSGTGNSLKIAKDIAQNIPDSKLQSITSVPATGEAVAIFSERMGIVFPVYVDGLPLIVERFICNLRINPKTYIFAVANYGGSAGGSLVQMEQLLTAKGCRLSAVFGIKMPDNTQILFPPGSPEEQQRDFTREKVMAAKIAQAVTQSAEEGRSLLQSAHRRRHEFNPAEMARKFFTDPNCNGCAICASVCPMNNIVMESSRPRWQDRCEMCLACMQWCPQQSIQFDQRTASWGRYHHPEILLEEMVRPSNA